MVQFTPNLQSPVQYVKGVGPFLSKVLSKKGIITLEDALYFLPRTYEDRTRLGKIAELSVEQNTTLLVKVVSSKEIRRGRKIRFQAVVSDGTGDLVLNWFFGFPSLKEEFSPGNQFLVYGRAKIFAGVYSISHPEYEKVMGFSDGKPMPSLNFGRVVPVYSETEGIKQKMFRRVMGEVLKMSLSQLDDPLPSELRQRLGLPSLRESFVNLHFPKVYPEQGWDWASSRRIIFEEFFVLQLGLGLRKRKLQAEKAFPLHDGNFLLDRFISSLPFHLTNDQKKTIEELRNDLSQPSAMARLLQGDVGSGKTVVALAAAVIAKSSGFQATLMAPTEILAQQHFRTAEKWLRPLGIEVVLMTHTNSSRSEIQEKISSGRADLVVGTHALFQKQVLFSRLGVVIVDEQHRFGVDQRNELMQKGTGFVPHLLMTTATPIPRTLSLTLYGDLNLSVIREKPPGRQKVRTSILREKQRPELYQKIRKTVTRGEQVYLIYPLVEASEKLELKSATEMYEKLKKEVFLEFSLALLHGRMRGEEKDLILKEFKEGRYNILVSTTVIEVGIDVPNATLMVIEHPERLGLSQLHQLRGRVGRGSAMSECVLVAGAGVGVRLRVMVNTDDGFEIAEEDLKIRGPGEFLGTRQHGLPGFRVGHILRDADILEEARIEATRILKEDPHLVSPDFSGIRKMVESRWQKKVERLWGG